MRDGPDIHSSFKVKPSSLSSPSPLLVRLSCQKRIRVNLVQFYTLKAAVFQCENGQGQTASVSGCHRHVNKTVSNLNHLLMHTPSPISQVITSLSWDTIHINICIGFQQDSQSDRGLWSAKETSRIRFCSSSANTSLTTSMVSHLIKPNENSN